MFVLKNDGTLTKFHSNKIPAGFCGKIYEDRDGRAATERDEQSGGSSCQCQSCLRVTACDCGEGEGSRAGIHCSLSTCPHWAPARETAPPGTGPPVHPLHPARPASCTRRDHMGSSSERVGLPSVSGFPPTPPPLPQSSPVPKDSSRYAELKTVS